MIEVRVCARVPPAARFADAHADCGDVPNRAGPQSKIVSVNAFGILVQLAEHQLGFVPDLFMSDVRLRNPAKRFKENATLPTMVRCACQRRRSPGGRCSQPWIGVCRLCPSQVLNVDRVRRRVHLTSKKSLIQSTLPKILRVGSY